MGANDGIISIASLLFGMAAASTEFSSMLIAGVSGTLAGAFSMAAGEYVSVKAQEDVQTADLELERKALESHPEEELSELAAIYRSRGLDAGLAQQVAVQLTQHDALGAHARDEIGIHDDQRAQPILAAVVSAASFVLGAAVPLFTILFSPMSATLSALAIASLVTLCLLGALSARLGGTSALRSILRITFWGSFAFLFTGILGAWLGQAL